ncbi:MAG: hypothetical protein WCD79_04935 [Chthoniobacteraceae bacterium]
MPSLWAATTPFRKGKIGRLPRKIREQINTRLADGMETEPLLAWLNAEKEVQDILRDQFDSRPISKQNLSAWRNGGFLDWLNRQQTVEMLRRDLVEQADSIEKLTDGGRFSDRLGTVLAVKLAEISMPLMDERGGDFDRRWRNTRQVVAELCRLRRADYLVARAKLDAEKMVQTLSRTRIYPTPSSE